MKNYTNKAELISDANKELKGYVLYHQSFGDGEIVEITGSSSLVFAINFAGAVKKISIAHAAARMTHDNNYKIAADFSEVYLKLEAAEEKALLEESRKREQAEKEAKAKAEEEAKAERAYKKYVESATTTATKIADKARSYKATVSEEDWVRSHISYVNASVPDFLDTWFRNKFSSAVYTPVNSHRKTSGGYNMKWGLSLSATVKKPETAPASVQMHLKGNKITDTEYLFGLCLNYGLQIGKQK